MQNEKLKVLDLFSGIGGFSLGLDRAGGFETVAFCEIADYPRSILPKHWHDVPVYEDVRNVTAERLTADGITPNAITAGFPCQDASVANTKGKGIEGERTGLWSEINRLIDELGPRVVILENSPLLRSRGFASILQDLAALGYDAEWHCIPACAVGSPQERDRIWIIAYPNVLSVEARSEHPGREKRCEPDSGAAPPILASFDSAGCEKQWRTVPAQKAYTPAECPIEWPVEPGVVRVVHGIPNRVDRIAVLGNSVVPQIPEIIGKAILEAEKHSSGLDSVKEGE